MKFDCNSFVTNSLRIIGNEHVTPQVVDLQTSERKIMNHGAHILGGLLGGPMILNELVTTELQSNFTLHVSLLLFSRSHMTSTLKC